MLRIRHAFFALVASLIVSPAFSQQILQGFEGGVLPSGWSTVHVEGQHSWVISNANPRTGSFSMFIEQEDISYDGTGNGENWLITPKVFSVSNGDELTFWYAPVSSDNSTGWEDDLDVYVSTTNTNLGSFSKVLTISMRGKSTSYQKGTVDLSSFTGNDIYIAIRNKQQNMGLGFYLDDITVTSTLNDDIGVTASSLNANKIYKTGETISFDATVYNFGSNSASSGIGIAYTVNGGSETVVNTSSSISSGGSTTVTFNNANAFVPSSPGNYKLRIYSKYASDANKLNDTTIVNMVVQTPITQFPYFTNFSTHDDWLVKKAPWKFTDVFKTIYIPEVDVIGPNGVKTKTALAQTYSADGKQFELLGPLLNLTNASKPIVSFYVASARINNVYYDELEVLVSLDGGVTFKSTPVLYKKTSGSGSGRLETVNLTTVFSPQSAASWRHEMVDLSNYIGESSVLVAFRASAHMGNNVWISDVHFFDANPSYYKAEKITTNGQTVTESNLGVSVKMNTIANSDSLRIAGFNTEPNEQTFVNNETATSNDGTVVKPNSLLDKYFTIAYSGNSSPLSRANYDISIDISSYSGSEDPEKFVIVKRADKEGLWVVQNTTLSGNVLKVSGLNIFSDFAVAYYSNAQPVTLVSFTGQSVRESVLLNWKTAQEQNISRYEVQRMDGSDWITLGSVNSNAGRTQNNYSFYDHSPNNGTNLYRLQIVGEAGEITYSEIVRVNHAISLNMVYQNVPNPFTNHTIIRYDLGHRANVNVAVFDLAGKRVAVLQEGVQEAGSHQVQWQPLNVPAGTYYYRVSIDGEVTTKSMIKLR
ncbi:MAG: choice-of-anchor J domain-containing protein [Chitinophagaceae bacterium]|nr:choice-of-anchor J domain-containing protein [Chitinophagaceae bacterium]